MFMNVAYLNNSTSTSLDQPLPDGNGRQIIITSATEKR